MRLLERYKSLFSNYLIAEHHNEFTIGFFCKSLYIFLLLKILLMWNVLPDLLKSAKFVGYNDFTVYGFLAITVILALVSTILEVNYFSSFFIFLFSFILTRSTLLVINGSDLILNLFLFLSVFLVKIPRFQNQTLREGQLVLSNFTFLFCRTQLALIYFLSGFDKLTSEAWRSGEAIHSIINLDFFFNPLISISFSQTGYMILAWIVILFELAFAVLIWVKKFRIAFLCLGLIFHLGIAFFLSLPDFGIVMVLTYSLFIPFERFKWTKKVAFGGS